MEPKSTVEVKGNDAKSLLGLIETLEEHDDVDEVHANFDIPESVLEQLAPPAIAAHADKGIRGASQNQFPCKW